MALNFHKSGIVPTDWKVAKVIPLHKSGFQSIIDDFSQLFYHFQYAHLVNYRTLMIDNSMFIIMIDYSC